MTGKKATKKSVKKEPTLTRQKEAAPEKAVKVEEKIEAPKEETPTPKTDTQDDLPTKIEGSEILSVEKNGDYYKIQAANGCGYTLVESEYKNLF